jgi:hypothetical protein
MTPRRPQLVTKHATAQNLSEGEDNDTGNESTKEARNEKQDNIYLIGTVVVGPKAMYAIFRET